MTKPTKLKDIKNINYQVSNTGFVRNKTTKRVLKTFLNADGYHVISLWNGKNSILKRVARLVAEAFIPNPENKKTVNHIDGNKINDNVDNLEWNTHSENMKHAYRTKVRVGTGVKGEKHYCSKLTEKQILEIRNRYKYDEVSYSDLGREYGVSYQNIYKIINRKSWKHI